MYNGYWIQWSPVVSVTEDWELFLLNAFKKYPVSRTDTLTIHSQLIKSLLREEFFRIGHYI